jgi:hypothetical protein
MLLQFVFITALSTATYWHWNPHLRRLPWHLLCCRPGTREVRVMCAQIMTEDISPCNGTVTHLLASMPSYMWPTVTHRHVWRFILHTVQILFTFVHPPHTKGVLLSGRGTLTYIPPALPLTWSTPTVPSSLHEFSNVKFLEQMRTVFSPCELSTWDWTYCRHSTVSDSSHHSCTGAAVCDRLTAGSAVLAATAVCCAVLMKCIAANIKFVLTTLQQGAGDYCLWLTDVSCLTDMFVTHRSFVS